MSDITRDTNERCGRAMLATRDGYRTFNPRLSRAGWATFTTRLIKKKKGSRDRTIAAMKEKGVSVKKKKKKRNAP